MKMKPPVKLLRTTASNPLVEIAFSGERNWPPALLTRPSMRPYLASTASMAPTTMVSSRMSQARLIACPPSSSISRCTSVSFSTVLPTIATLAPSAASSWTVQRPIPLPPPVTMMVCPLNRSGLNTDRYGIVVSLTSPHRRLLRRPLLTGAGAADEHCARLSYTILLSAIKANARWERIRDGTEHDHHHHRGPRRDRDPDIEPPRSAQRRLTRHDRGTDRLLLGAARSADHARRDFARQRTRVLGRRRTRIGRVCRAWQGTTTAPAQDAAELFRRHSFDALL